jgi:hypothetical protein
MRQVIVMLLGLVVLAAPAAELKRFAPAVEFTHVEWWGPAANGAMTWWAGKDQTPYPANMGGIAEGRITGTQELRWSGGSYGIEAVERNEAGAIEVTFSKGRLVMARTHDGYYLVDYHPPGMKVAINRFRTSRKATAHDDP